MVHFFTGNIMELLSSIVNSVYAIFKFFLIVLMVEITVVITIGVASRYFFNAPVYWAEEVTRYSFVWATFLGAACAFKNRELVAMTVIFNALPQKSQRWLLFVIELIMFCFLVTATYFGIQMTQLVAPQLSVATRLSMSYLYVIIPVSCGFMLFCSIENIIKLAKGHTTLQSWGENI